MSNCESCMYFGYDEEFEDCVLRRAFRRAEQGTLHVRPCPEPKFSALCERLMDHTCSAAMIF